MSGQHCDSYDVKWEIVHCYPRIVDCCCTWSERAVEGGLMSSLESQSVFQNLLIFCNKSLIDWSLEEGWILFPLNLNVTLYLVSGNIEILGKQKLLFSRDQSLILSLYICLFSFVAKWPSSWARFLWTILTAWRWKVKYSTHWHKQLMRLTKMLR